MPTKKLDTSRKLSLPKRQLFNPRTWRHNLPIPPRKPLPSTIFLIEKTFHTLFSNWKPYALITGIYTLCVLVLIKGLAFGSFSGLDSVANDMSIKEKIYYIASQFFSFSQSATINTSAASSLNQIIISAICILALIFALRTARSHHKPTMKQSFYEGMSPLVQFLLVLVMVGVHLIPIAVGSFLFSLSMGILSSSEYILAIIVLILFVLWSMYLFTHSLFALFIVTLPDTTPLQALRSAKQLVIKRRLLIWRKLLLFLFCISFFSLIIFVPFIIWLTYLAPVVYFIGSSVLFTIVQVFLYTLYRELLQNE